MKNTCFAILFALMLITTVASAQTGTTYLSGELIELENCVPNDVISRFGVPSLRWGTNDNYPCTLLYLCEADQARYVYFDFWAEWFKNEEGLRVPGKYGPKPLLRNIRVPAASFPEEFLFTQIGRSLLAAKQRTAKDGGH